MIAHGIYTGGKKRIICGILLVLLIMGFGLAAMSGGEGENVLSVQDTYNLIQDGGFFMLTGVAPPHLLEGQGKKKTKGKKKKKKT